MDKTPLLYVAFFGIGISIGWYWNVEDTLAGLRSKPEFADSTVSDSAIGQDAMARALSEKFPPGFDVFALLVYLQNQGFRATWGDAATSHSAVYQRGGLLTCAENWTVTWSADEAQRVQSLSADHSDSCSPTSPMGTPSRDSSSLDASAVQTHASRRRPQRSAGRRRSRSRAGAEPVRSGLLPSLFPSAQAPTHA